MPKQNYVYNPMSSKTISIPGWAEAFNNGTLLGMGGENASAAYTASAWAFRAVGLRAETIASAPLKLYDANDEEIETHPLITLLGYVNNQDNPSDLWRKTESGLLIYGAGYWEKRRGPGRITELFAMNPSSIEQVMYDKRDPTAGITGFKQRKESGGKIFPREDVVYFRGAYDPSNDMNGIASLTLASLAAMGEGNADKYLDAFFRNGAVPALVMTTDQQLTDPQLNKIIEWWRRLFQGVRNQHKVGIMGSGLKPTQIGSSNKDLALSEIRQEMHRTISTALGVPELLISPTNAADLTPVKMAEKIFYNTTILPRWNWYEEVLNAELLSEYPDLVSSGAYLKFDTSEIGALQEDENELATRLSMLVEKKIIKASVAAVQLGYQETDVPEEPEPEPQPIELQQQIEEMPEETQAQPELAEEMRRWQRKVTNAVKAGKAANVEFVSSIIPPETMLSIREGLKNCQSIDEIPRIFASPLPKLQAAAVNDYGDLIAELKAARSAILSDDKETLTNTVQSGAVNFNISDLKPPEVKITNDIETPQVIVNVPEQTPPVINVNVPEQEPPVVNVNVSPTPITNQVDVNIPEKGKIKLAIKRDAQGRITEVSEV